MSFRSLAGVLLRRRRGHVTPALTAYKALDRYVLLPHADASGPGRAADVERVRTLPCDASDVELGTAAVACLVPPRTLRVDRAEHWQAERRLLQRAFGVTTDGAWSSNATCVNLERVGATIRLSPWRHHGQRHNWVGRLGDPVAEAAVADAHAVGRSLREMLSLSLPPG
jgi:hypothetical protein